MCRLLRVTRQGYYAFAKRAPSKWAQDEARLHERLRALHVENRGTYGSPRMRDALQKEGFRVSKRRIERAMRGLGIVACSPRKCRQTTKADPRNPITENVLARDFTASKPNERWVTDITYVWTDEGWCYLAAILDLYSRAVVGWAMDHTLETRLPINALDMAVRRRMPGRGLLHHSDRGCQYTSAAYRETLDALGVVVSMSRRGNCWDNAVAESFFATLKRELINRQRWSSRAELRAAVFEYIEVFYNRRRAHSALAYNSPAQAELQYELAQAA
jgi:putative transposase